MNENRHFSHSYNKTIPVGSNCPPWPDFSTKITPLHTVPSGGGLAQTPRHQPIDVLITQYIWIGQ